MLFYEGLIVLIPILFGLEAYLEGQYLTGLAVLYGLEIGLLSQALVYVKVGRSPGYVVFLADRATDMSDLELHLKALRRLGRVLSGGYADAAALLAFAAPRAAPVDRPKSLDEIFLAIELSLVEKCASLSGDQKKAPLVRYAEDVERAFAQTPVTLDMWRNFLLSKYEAVPEACRALAGTPVERTRLGRLRGALEANWSLVSVLLAVAGLVVTIVAAILGGRPR